MTRIEIEAIVALLITLLFIGILAYERHEGKVECEAEAHAAALAQQARDIATYEAKIKVVEDERNTYEKALLTPVTNAPVYRIVRSAGACQAPAAPATSGGDHGGTPLRSEDQGQPAASWSSAPLIQTGKDADAQVTVLQDYIRRVCTPNLRTQSSTSSP